MLFRSPLLASTVPLIRAPQAWARGIRGRGQTVAVIDTGVDATHPFLENRMVAEACFSASEPVLQIRSACPNGADTMIGPGSGAPCRDDSACFHGTHVAGIAAGRGSSFSGVAPDASVMSIQIFRHYPALFCGGEPCIRAATSDLIRALEHVRDNADRLKIASVNLSLGGGSYRTYCDDHPYKPVIDQLRERGRRQDDDRDRPLRPLLVLHEVGVDRAEPLPERGTLPGGRERRPAG